MKRKAESQLNGANGKGILKKRAKTVLTTEDIHGCFRKGLFAKAVLDKYTKQYAASSPYKHSVISSLINDDLLRSVRDEVRENVHFTPKETDIYKIHQSGDLANLDGLEDGALERLPSLLKLRDAMYSVEFRRYVAAITGSGELSGRKTDMAINVYTPGCHLLCHDDVIGSRRVSYILYLTDPDVPWKEEWGGALRLFPTKTFEDEDGEKTVTPSPDYSKVIPPAWNQLSFFAVQPGESFHDVEEVYHALDKEQLAKQGGRIRMAISGWYHIPQIGEEGYVKGAEEKWGKNSSLMQLQGHPDRYDFPQTQVVAVEPVSEPTEEKVLEEEDIDFLLKYMAPTYLTPDTMEQVKEQFVEESSVTLDTILSKKFSARVRSYVEEQEKSAKPVSSEDIEKAGVWKVARPPHKHRYLYRQQPASKSQKSNGSRDKSTDPIQELLADFLPSPQFQKWLEIATDCDIETYDLLARRFRRGMDYSLATGHEGDSRLEITLGLTPTTGWGGEEETEEEADEDAANGAAQVEAPSKSENGKKSSKRSKAKKVEEEGKEAQQKRQEEEEADVGGHEVYMAADVEDDNEDAAIYKSSSSGDNNDASEEDSILFTTPASWNKLSIVLRDSGVLKFVKYVSRSAKGDRWDICGAFGVKELEDDEDGDEDGEENEEAGQENGVSLESSGEEDVFNGFPDSDDGDSDSD